MVDEDVSVRILRLSVLFAVWLLDKLLHLGELISVVATVGGWWWEGA